MKIYVKSQDATVDLVSIEDLHQALLSIHSKESLPSYIKKHINTEGQPRYYVVAYFKNEKASYLLTLVQEQLCRYPLRKEEKHNLDNQERLALYYPLPAYALYQFEKIVSENDELIDGKEKIFSPALTRDRFTKDHNFAVLETDLLNEDAIKEDKISSINTDEKIDENFEDSAEITFPYLEGTTLTYDQQRRLYFDCVIEGAGRFYLVLLEMAQQSKDILTSVLLKDELLSADMFSEAQKKYIEEKYLPFFEIDRVNTVSDLGEVTIQAVLFYYQFCVFRKLKELGLEDDIPNEDLRSYPDQALDCVVGKLPHDFSWNSCFWEKRTRPVDPTLVSPNAEVIQALSLVFGVGPEDFYNSGQRHDLIAQFLAKYSLEELENIYAALSDYKNTLDDPSGEKHFRLEYQVAYDHLHVLYPIPENERANFGAEPISNFYENPLTIQQRINELLNPQLNNFIPSLPSEILSGRFRLEILVNDAHTISMQLIKLMRLVKKIIDNPNYKIRSRELVMLMKFSSMKILEELFILPSLVRNILALIQKPGNNLSLKFDVSDEKKAAFYTKFFEYFPSDENSYFFITKLPKTDREKVSKYIPDQRLLDDIKHRGDLNAFFELLSGEKKFTLARRLIELDLIKNYINSSRDILQIISCCIAVDDPLLKEKFISQIEDILPDVVDNSIEFCELFSIHGLTFPDKKRLYFALIPYLQQYLTSMQDFRIILEYQLITNDIKALIVNDLLQKKIIYSLTSNKREFYLAFSLCKSFGIRVSASDFINQFTDKLSYIIHDYKDFTELFSYENMKDTDKLTCLNALSNSLNHYLTNIYQFNRFMANDLIPYAIKHSVTENYIQGFNQSLGMQSNSSDIALLAGIYQIAQNFNAHGGSNLIGYVKVACARVDITADQLVDNIENWARNLSTIYSSGIKLAVTKYVKKWQSKNELLDVSAICAASRTTQSAQFFSQSQRLVVPPSNNRPILRYR